MLCIFSPACGVWCGLVTLCMQAASIAIQSVWRGYRGRQTTAERRREMAAFLRMVRQRERDQRDQQTSFVTKAARSLLKSAKNMLYVVELQAVERRCGVPPPAAAYFCSLVMARAKMFVVWFGAYSKSKPKLDDHLSVDTYDPMKEIDESDSDESELDETTLLA